MCVPRLPEIDSFCPFWPAVALRELRAGLPRQIDDYFMTAHEPRGHRQRFESVEGAALVEHETRQPQIPRHLASLDDLAARHQPPNMSLTMIRKNGRIRSRSESGMTI